MLDGAGWHAAKALEVPVNITLVLLPPYAPELNPIENVWAYLRANRLAICVFETYQEIVTQYCPPLSGLLSAALLFSNFQVGGIGQ